MVCLPVGFSPLNAGGGSVCLLLDGVSGYAVVMLIGIRDEKGAKASGTLCRKPYYLSQ